MSENERKREHIYQVTHRETGEKRIVASFDTHSACSGLGWMVGDCHVVEMQGEKHRVAGDWEPLCIRVPCNTCPFQWAECKLLPGSKCPCSINTPDQMEWLIQVTKSHLCSHAGIALTRNDYYLHQKWLPMELALQELAPK